MVAEQKLCGWPGFLWRPSGPLVLLLNLINSDGLEE